MVDWNNIHHWSDFLCRPALQGDIAKIRAVCSNRSFFVTGAAGSIGSLLARAVVGAGAPSVTLLDRSPQGLQQVCEELSTLQSRTECVSVVGDVCDSRLLDSLYRKCRPQIVLHAAALKYVPLLETDPLSAIRTNTLGTHAVAESAARHGVDKLVFISTDKAVCPVNMLGASKRLGELVTLAMNSSATRMSCVRFGNVLGSQGSVVPIFEDQIRRRVAVTVTHPEVTRYFLTGDEAVLLVLAAVSLEAGGQVLVPRLGESLKIADLANYLIRRAGLVPGEDVKVEFTKLRPGDKMAEKLVAPFEGKEPAVPGLLDRVHTRRVPKEELVRWIAQLSRCLESNDAQALVASVCEMIPEYHPGPELKEYLDSAHSPVHPL